MKLKVDFSSLKATLTQMGAELHSLTEVKIEQTALEILKSDDGAEVDINEDISFSVDGSLVHKETGKPILLYIREPYGHTPKYHIASCSTLTGYINTGRIERYVAAYRDKENPSTRFKVNLLQEDGYSRKPVWKELQVCKNCLKQLDYKGYSGSKYSKVKIFNEFDITEFFELYDTTKHNIKSKREENDFNMDEYPPNWNSISSRYRHGVNHTCEKCSINLQENPKFLHVHHRSGFKNNCDDDNLIALCIKCHSEEAQHSHMKHSPDYRNFELLYSS